MADAISLNMKTQPMKIVVFDLDETLGSFVEISMFWDALEAFAGAKLPDSDFFAAFELFPNFLRPEILKILEYLMQKKKEKQCDKIMIYTNNQGPKSWVQLISAYLNHKVGYEVFDNIIAAFKVHGKRVELGRTTHNKCIKDLIRCTQVPANTEICFLDDVHHPLMEHDTVYYINVKPYHYSLPYKYMAETYFQQHPLPNVDQPTFVQGIVAYMRRFNYTVVEKSELEQEVDQIVSKKIIAYLDTFFKKKQTATRRKKAGRSRKK